MKTWFVARCLIAEQWSAAVLKKSRGLRVIDGGRTRCRSAQLGLSSRARGVQQPFLPGRVKKVDEFSGNVLIRGPMPLAGESWHYAYEEIARASGVPLEDYDFAVVSLIDCTGERPMLEAEFAAFGHEAPGPSYWPPFERSDYVPWAPVSGVLDTGDATVPASLYWWPIEGLPEGVRPDQFLSSPGWNLSGLVELVHKLMSDKRRKPLALYAHCTLGADRTGALHTSYLVRKGAHLNDAIQSSDSSTPAGAPSEDYRRLRAAYASSLGR